MRLTALLCAKKLTKTAIQATEREIKVKAPWGNIAALSWGDPTNPPIFLCHGRLDSCTCFRPLVHQLPADRFYVSVDLPGNGRSDPLTRGARLTIFDFVPALVKIKEHFKWEKFVYVGHSLGALLGKYYNIIYPGQMTRVVELDPEPAYLPSGFMDLRTWYRAKYETFYRDYGKYAGGVDAAPKYTYEEIRSRLMKARGIDEETTDQILERCLVPAGDGKYRITFDQRFKVMALMPFSADHVKDLYTASATPTLAVFAQETIDRGVYAGHPFALDDDAWPHRNYRSLVLPGGHDVQLHHTEKVAQLIVDFLKK